MRQSTSGHLWTLLAAVALLPIMAQAEPEEPIAPVLKNAGVLQPNYGGLRIGDIAPLFAFPDLGNAKGPLWQSSSLLGQASLMLVTIGAGAKPETTRELLSPEFNQVTQQLKQIGIETVVVVSASAYIKLERSVDQTYTILRDDRNKLPALLGPRAAALTVIAIDRAGFIRRIEPVAAALAGTITRTIGDPTPKLEVGKPAPDFAIADMNGQVRRLADFRGQKNLLLTFFPKCFTGGCANHLTSLASERLAFLANDVQVMAVSVDPAEGEQGQLAFAKQLGIDFPLLPDTSRNLSLLYNSVRPDHRSARASFFIDKDGILRFIDNKVVVRSHGPDILRQIAEIGLLKAG